MSQQDLDNYELANRVAELTLDVERFKAENMALRARLPFTGNYEVIAHNLSEPVVLRGRKITQVLFTMPVY